jgi:hypothetical protein
VDSCATGASNDRSGEVGKSHSAKAFSNPPARGRFPFEGQDATTDHAGNDVCGRNQFRLWRVAMKHIIACLIMVAPGTVPII